MQSILKLFALFGGLVLLTACASTPAPKSGAASQELEVKRRLHEVLTAAETKDLARLDSYHLYGPKFTKFTTESAERLDANTARTGEHNGLSALRSLHMDPENLKIDFFGHTAIVTCILRSHFSIGTTNYDHRTRTTLVFIREASEWKIAHEHLSAIKPDS